MARPSSPAARPATRRVSADTMKTGVRIKTGTRNKLVVQGAGAGPGTRRTIRGRLFYERTWDYAAKTAGKATAPATKEYLPGVRVELLTRDALNAPPRPVASGWTTDGVKRALVEDNRGDMGAFCFEDAAVGGAEQVILRVHLEDHGGRIVRVVGAQNELDKPDFAILEGQVIRADVFLEQDAFGGTGPVDLGDVELDNDYGIAADTEYKKELFARIDKYVQDPATRDELKTFHFARLCDLYKSVWLGHKRIRELSVIWTPPPCIVHYPNSEAGSYHRGRDKNRHGHVIQKDDDHGLWLEIGDDWDRSVILHEYGHFIDAEAVGDLPWPGYRWESPKSTEDQADRHGADGEKDHYHVAWKEGTATFIGCVLADTPIYQDAPNSWQGAGNLCFLDDDAIPGDKTGTAFREGHQKTRPLGAHHEDNVARALWQIVVKEGVGFQRGFWQAYTYKRRPTTFFEFVENWRELGLKSLGALVQAARDHDMEFGYLYRTGWSWLDASAGTSRERGVFRSVDELVAKYGTVRGEPARDPEAARAEYIEELYNLNTSDANPQTGMDEKASEFDEVVRARQDFWTVPVRYRVGL